MHSEFVFSILLTMDLCFNSKDVTASEKRQLDVKEACKALQNVRGPADAVRLNRALAVLSRALKKHKEQVGFPTTTDKTGGLEDNPLAATQSSTALPTNSLLPITPTASINPFQQSVAPQPFPRYATTPLDQQSSMNFNFDNLWSEFMDIAPNFEGQDWSSLLSDLDFQVTVS